MIDLKRKLQHTNGQENGEKTGYCVKQRNNGKSKERYEAIQSLEASGMPITRFLLPSAFLASIIMMEFHSVFQ